MSKIISVRFNEKEYKELEESKRVYEEWTGLEITVSQYIKLGLSKVKKPRYAVLSTVPERSEDKELTI